MVISINFVQSLIIKQYDMICALYQHGISNAHIATIWGGTVEEVN